MLRELVKYIQFYCHRTSEKMYLFDEVSSIFCPLGSKHIGLCTTKLFLFFIGVRLNMRNKTKYANCNAIIDYRYKSLN